MPNVQALRQLRMQGRVPERDIRFVDNLLRDDAGRGLSIKQAEWVDKLVARFTAPAATPVAVGSMSGVVQLLGRAKAAGLKFPKLWLQFPDGRPLRITVAGERSRTPGFLMLSDGESFGSNLYFGRISPDGRLEIGRDGFAVQAQLVALLERLAADPAGVAAEFGHLTGHCCFCSLALKDERSVAVGYGPTCAQKFGVPWGMEAARNRA
jgi:Family of unknown function (DUF6011)